MYNIYSVLSNISSERNRQSQNDNYTLSFISRLPRGRVYSLSPLLGHVRLSKRECNVQSASFNVSLT